MYIYFSLGFVKDFDFDLSNGMSLCLQCMVFATGKGFSEISEDFLGDGLLILPDGRYFCFILLIGFDFTWWQSNCINK